MELATRANYRNLGDAKEMCDAFRSGTKIGCIGRGHLPKVYENGAGVYTYSDCIPDTLKSWDTESFLIAFGPLKEEE